MVSAIIGHLVGDYLLQNDWMALHKKKSSFRCAIHCAIWTACVCLFAGWWHNGERFDGSLHDLKLGPVVILFVTHFIQDRTNVIRWWMGLVGQEKFATGPCSPWSIIVVDNVWHLVTIWAVWQYWFANE